MKLNLNYQFVGKALWLKDKQILVIGDLHIGYEQAMIEAGILTPMTQIKELIKELRGLIDELSPKKIIFLGDIKHLFSFNKEESFSFNEVLEFLRDKFEDENIIFIKGNHDTIDYSFQNKFVDYYTEGNIAFIHGDKSFLEIFDKKIKTIVMGHIHPSITIADSETNKKEKYKCFLTGKFNKKEIIILPSFLGIQAGSPINYFEDRYEDYFSIIPKKEIMNFEVHVIGKEKTYDFGKVKKLQR